MKNTLSEYEPGDEIEITTIDESGNKFKQKIILDEREGKAYLGVGFLENQNRGFISSMINIIQKIKNPSVYYEATWDGGFAQFIYDLIWWIIVINILVALFNMLPVSILDGGRFFYLTIWGITKNEKFASKAFRFATWFILALFVIMMIRWLIGFVG